MATNTINENVEQTILDFGTIKQAIINKGVSVPIGTPTSQYGDKILSIQTGPFVLYSNSSGTYSTITLNDSVENYDTICVYYFWEGIGYSNCYSEFLASDQGGYLKNINCPSDGNGVCINAKKISLTGNTLTFATTTFIRGIYITSGNSSYTSGGFSGNYDRRYPQVVKVVGYKY